ncbi:hypothetical protein QE360_003360 [Sphingomonas sp. SORGH_AS789]|nr:hypothetical protein [Sphingomonas sp. SORGH_AS_0789]MDR6149934.1 hypothetical protein [Sphingomonas sp. SORGH_AS_0742]
MAWPCGAVPLQMTRRLHAEGPGFLYPPGGAGKSFAMYLPPRFSIACMFAAEFEPMKIPARRRSKRTEVKVEADYEGDGLARALCRVLDISTHGARLETYTELRSGMTIWLRLPKVGQVIARIVWADDFAAGCQFQTPLAQDAYEVLAPLA